MSEFSCTNAGTNRWYFFFGGDYLLSIIITDFCRLSSFMLFMFIFTNSGFGDFKSKQTAET